MEFIDDTLPLPADVERVFLQCAGETLTEAISWLEERGINPEPIGTVALVEYAYVWDSSAGRYNFKTYGSDHVGPKRAALAVPIYEAGVFVDLLLIADDNSFETVSCRAPWLGRENIAAQSVRLHPHPLDFLEAGCTGACHVALISRKALKDLRGAQSIVCNDIGIALEAWSWAFDADEAALGRFECDDTPASIRQYFEDEVRWRVACVAAIPEAFR